MSKTVNQKHADVIIELDHTETVWWRKKIGSVRKKFVKTPKKLVDDHFSTLKDKEGLAASVKMTSEFIRDTREITWGEYVKSELLFYKEVVRSLLAERKALREILAHSIDEETLQALLKSQNKEGLIEFHSTIFGDFAGRVFPYFYELAKSVTQSRRTRAGTVFETLIANIMKIYEYPYSSQSELGQRAFKTKGLGKKVDGLVPNIDAYLKYRNKCLVITMKTTLRERWQEVVEELKRTNVPSIYLLTLDEDISGATLNIMNEHNITLVTYKKIKEKYASSPNVISFEKFFNEEIPHALDWWKMNHPELLPQSPTQ